MGDSAEFCDLVDGRHEAIGVRWIHYWDPTDLDALIQIVKTGHGHMRARGRLRELDARHVQLFVFMTLEPLYAEAKPALERLQQSCDAAEINEVPSPREIAWIARNRARAMATARSFGFIDTITSEGADRLGAGLGSLWRMRGFGGIDSAVESFFRGSGESRVVLLDDDQVSRIPGW